MPNLPAGTVTFVFTDVEGSTTLLKRVGDEPYRQILATHRRVVREAFSTYGGHEIDTQGDAFFYSFARVGDAVAGAVAVHRAHASEAWSGGANVRVRIGMHTGEPAVGDGGYTGLDVVRAARIAAVAAGGQTLLSEATRAIVSDRLPDGVAVRSLGTRRLKDIDRPERLYELVVDGLEHPTARAARPTGRVGWADVERMTERTRERIEQRVLAELAESLTSDALPQIAGVPRVAANVPRAPVPPRRSVAAEIGRLRELRDAGALTDAQYERAVDRVIGGDAPDER